MGSLIVAAKYLNDASLKNTHWAYSSGVFGRRDVQRIEREFLDVLEFDLSVHEEDLVHVCNQLVEADVIEGLRKPKVDVVHSLEAVRRIWEEKARTAMKLAQHQVKVQTQVRPEKRQKSDSMDIDVEEERGRYKERRTGAYASVPDPRVSGALSVSPTSSSSSCSSSSASPASSNSPQTPPPSSASAPSTAYEYPHYIVPRVSTPSKSSSFPTVISISSASTPSPRASLPPAPIPQPRSFFPFFKVNGGPKPAFPIASDMDAEMEDGGLSFESPTCIVPTYRARSRTSSRASPYGSGTGNQTHKRSSALAMYPSYVNLEA
jgi:hypothetical protein